MSAARSKLPTNGNLAELRALVRAVRPRPHAVVIPRHRGPGTVLVRFLGKLAADQVAVTQEALFDRLPAHLLLDLEVAPTTFDLDTLASNVVSSEEGALDVLVDAMLECELLSEKSATAEGVRSRKAVRAWLEEAAKDWAYSAFGLERPHSHPTHAPASGLTINGVLIPATDIKCELRQPMAVYTVAQGFAGASRRIDVDLAFTTDHLPEALENGPGDVLDITVRMANEFVSMRAFLTTRTVDHDRHSRTRYHWEFSGAAERVERL